MRQIGERVCRSLAGDERIDSEQRLLRVVRVLDDLDIATLQDQGGKELPTEFSQVGLLLTRTTAAFDEFIKPLPPMPDAFVDD